MPFPHYYPHDHEQQNGVGLAQLEGRNTTWPTSVSIYDKTLKGGKIHRYNDIRDFANLQHLLLLLQ